MLKSPWKSVAEAMELRSCLTGEDSLEANVPNFLSLIASRVSRRIIMVIAAAMGSRCSAEPLRVLTSRAEPGITISNLRMGLRVHSLNSLPTAQQEAPGLCAKVPGLDFTQKTAAFRPHLPQCPGLI